MLDRVAGREQDHREAVSVGAPATQQVVSRLARQHPVEHHQIGRVLLDVARGLLGRGHRVDVVAASAQRLENEQPRGELVFDVEDRGRHAAFRLRAVSPARGLPPVIAETRPDCNRGSTGGRPAALASRRPRGDTARDHGQRERGQGVSTPAEQTGRARAALLDRDGTINRDTGYVGDPAAVELLPGVARALGALARAGYRLIVVTNQSGIARGLFPPAAVEAVHERIAALLRAEDPDARIDAWLYCPHHPEGRIARWAVRCRCRKPAPGLFERAAERHRLDLARSVAFGDAERDVEAARRAGVGTTVRLAPDGTPSAADHRARDLPAAVRWWLARERSVERSRPERDAP
ncbi:MAG: HAD family hydrolase [Planctomycetota bacterium]|nr:MAG: HAD family hydrolase [Planctomycetota bacterium]